MGAQQALPGAKDAVERDPLDFNRTPAWVTRLVVPLLGQPRTVLDVGCGDGAIGKVLRQAWPDVDMSACEVDQGRYVLAHAARTSGGVPVYVYVALGDWIQPEARAQTILTGEWQQMAWGRPDLIISNPPFGLAALPFLQRAVERVAPGGTVAFLLPTHWDQDEDSSCGPDAPETKDKALNALRRSLPRYARQRWLDSMRLPNGREGYCKLPIVGRPSFRGGATASDRYAWYLLGEAWAGRPGFRLHAIPPEETTGQLELLGGAS